GSPNPLRGYVAWRGQLLEAASNRGVRDPRGARHYRDAATPCCPRLRRGPNPPRSLRQRWRQGFVLRPAARDVHSSSVAVVVSHSFSYFLTLPNLLPATWDHILWNFIFGCVCGAVFGFISEFFVLGIRHLLPIPILSDVIGGVLGGGLA